MEQEKEKEDSTVDLKPPKQTESIMLRCNRTQYDEIASKAIESNLSINSWLLKQAGFEVPTGQKPKGRKIGAGRNIKPPATSGVTDAG